MADSPSPSVESLNTDKKDAEPSLIKLLGNPALLPGENAKSLLAIQRAILKQIACRDVTEEMLANDVVHYQLEIARLEKLRAAFVKSNLPQALERILLSLGLPQEADFISNWASGEAEEVKWVEEFLKDSGLDLHALTAEVEREYADLIDDFGRRRANCEMRRNSALREIDRHRSEKARRLPQAPVIEDAEYEDVPIRRSG